MPEENKTSVLETLVGDGKKFKTPEDLAKGKVEADAFITTLQNQINVLTDELGKANNTTERKALLENLMTSLTNSNTTTNTETKVNNQPSNPGNNQASTLSHDDVVKIVEAREAEAAKARNVAAAMSPFNKLYGDKAAEALATKAKELGLTVESLTSLAAQSPQAFLAVVGVNSTDTTTRSMATHSSVNPLGPSNPGAPAVRNKAYYDGVMKQMGALKFIQDHKLQVQLHRDMSTLGDAWDS